MFTFYFSDMQFVRVSEHVHSGQSEIWIENCCHNAHLFRSEEILNRMIDNVKTLKVISPAEPFLGFKKKSSSEKYYCFTAQR